ncbi:MAG: hypothetical protein E6226_02340 [Veillonella sp.]|uniref:hypothetical protein n=1 Tax=Veillonella TaxID=29465 RepID=UPI00241C7106|nr:MULTISPECIES: hypothetical protein [Veillonella]MDU5097448.1 hypothetical protein [Veillonella sp.]
MMKIEHLRMIQNVISRMASNSFIIKGWAITTFSALYAFAYLNHKSIVLIFGVLFICIFWYHDAFYLLQERRYCELYDKVRGQSEEDIDFNMSVPASKENVWNVIRRPILISCYGFLLILTILLFILIQYNFL